MHIPTKESQKVEILTFDEARKYRDSSAVYDRDRWIYVPDFYSEYRYILGTLGEKPLVTIGINPSTAEPDNLDNTLKSVERIALGNGFDSFIMFNVYAQRATNPDHMDREFNRELHRENMLAFRYIMEHSGSSPAIWAAWGAIVEKRPYLRECLSDMVSIGNEYGAVWYKAGKVSLKGHPHHPLYLKKDSLLERFDMESYLSAGAK
ncbi:MAG: DUF1643 domain-containing protein [Clostridia bacterium]|nr:DUF1643 domain-containing protein [Clostridia bacterium]